MAFVVLEVAVFGLDLLARIVEDEVDAPGSELMVWGYRSLI